MTAKLPEKDHNRDDRSDESNEKGRGKVVQTEHRKWGGLSLRLVAISGGQFSGAAKQSLNEGHLAEPLCQRHLLVGHLGPPFQNARLSKVADSSVRKKLSIFKF